MIINKKVKGVLLGLLSAGAFGIIPLFSIPLMKGMGIPSILFYRFLFATIIVIPICLAKEKKLRVNYQELKSLFFLATIFALTSLGLIWSYSYIPSGIATTIHFLYPILVSAIMIVFYKERKTIRIIIATFLSFVGVALLCWNNDENIKIIGVILALITVVTYAIYIVGLDKFLKKTSPLIITFYVLLFCSIIFGFYAVMTTGIEQIKTGNDWFNLFSLALFPTVLADYVLIRIVSAKYISPTEASILGVMEPVVATFMGVLFFAEHFNTFSFIGLLLVLFSVLIVIVSKANNISKNNT